MRINGAFFSASSSVAEKLFKRGIIDAGQMYACNRFFLAWNAHNKPASASIMRYDDVALRGCAEGASLTRITLADEFRQIVRGMPARQYAALRSVCCDDVPLHRLGVELHCGFYKARDSFMDALCWLDSFYAKEKSS